jgi:hypothetical protein
MRRERLWLVHRHLDRPSHLPPNGRHPHLMLPLTNLPFSFYYLYFLASSCPNFIYLYTPIFHLDPLICHAIIPLTSSSFLLSVLEWRSFISVSQHCDQFTYHNPIWKRDMKTSSCVSSRPRAELLAKRPLALLSLQKDGPRNDIHHQLDGFLARYVLLVAT